MQLLIDGYNLLKKIKHSAHISDKERENFIKKLNHYGHQKKLSIVLVFDGGPFNWPMREKVSTVLEVVYSGVRESADDYIKQYIETHKSFDILLITSDRELVTHARLHAIPSMDSYEFSEFINSNESPTTLKSVQNQKAHKMVASAHKELDLLMEQLAVPKKKEPEGDLERNKKKQQISKSERIILKKIKKL